MQGVILPHSNRWLNAADINIKIKQTKNHIAHLVQAQTHRQTHGGKRFRARQIALRTRSNIYVKRLELLSAAKAAITLAREPARYAIHRIIQSIEDRVTNCYINSYRSKKVKGHYGHMTSHAPLKAENAIFECSIEAKSWVRFKHVQVIDGHNLFSCRSIQAETCRFDSIKAHGDVNLVDTIARRIVCTDLTWKNLKADIRGADSILSLCDVILENIYVQDSVEAKAITARNCGLNTVNAEFDVQLYATYATNVSVSKGQLIWINARIISTTDKIVAKSGMTLKNIVVHHSVECTHGMIVAEDCQFDKVKSRYGIRLLNTPARSCIVSFGELCIFNDRMTYDRTRSYDRLTANKNIDLHNVIVKKMVKSKSGKINARNCHLQAIEAPKINFENVSCVSVHLRIHNNKSNIRLRLQDSTIAGNLVIEQAVPSSIPVQIKVRGNGSIKGNIIFKDCIGSLTYL